MTDEKKCADLTHKNPLGDWKEARRFKKIYLVKAQEIQRAAELLAKLMKEFTVNSREFYKSIPKIDALYVDSPMGEHKMRAYVRIELAQRGMLEAARELTHMDPAFLKTFLQHVEEAAEWAMKFEKEEKEQDQKITPEVFN